MNKVAIVRSQHLIEHEGEGTSSLGYRWSTHKSGIQRFENALKFFDIPYLIWDENELDRTDLLKKKNVKVIVVPEMRVCAETTFQSLMKLVAQGWLVFSAIDSFYYDRSGDRTIESRVKEIFRLAEDCNIRSRKLRRGDIRFTPTRFSWLTDGLPTTMKYDKWVLGVLGEGGVLATHGYVDTKDPRTGDDKPDDVLKGKTVPAFLIREYPSGGLLLYACFAYHEIDYLKTILRNIVHHMSEPQLQEKQIRLLKIIVVILAAIVGLFVAREAIGDTWITYLGGIIIGVILGVVGNKLTDLANWWISS